MAALHEHQGGRPSIDPEKLALIHRLRARGVKLRIIAARVGLSRSYISRLLLQR